MDVTVLVITHRKGELLRRTLTAACAQLSPGDELLVIDDGGEDYKIATQFPCRYVTVPHRGYRLASLQNVGALLARHDYIVKLDGDCVPDSGWLSAYRAALAPGRLVAGRIDWELPDGIIRPDGRMSREVPPCLWGGNFGLPRRELLALGGFAEELDGTWGGEEQDLEARWRASGKEFVYLPEARAVHQWHPIPHGRYRTLSSAARDFLSARQAAYERGEFPPPLREPSLEYEEAPCG